MEMNAFTLYVELGWSHIISMDALDHQLFLTALMSVYLVRDWKRILILVTAFTLGHSLTLALSVLDWIRFASEWVEFLIPVTIVLTALFNFLQPEPTENMRRVKYALAAGFGLIHGMGFANNIRFMLVPDESLLGNLLAFNLGLELGQIAVVIGLIGMGYLLVNRLGLPQRYWFIALNAASFGVALWFSLQRVPFN